MKIIFFGSDDFALAHLARLLKSPHTVAACVTQTDKAKGRHLKVASSPVREFSEKNKIPVLQPKTLKDADFIDQLKRYDSDLFVVVAYGRILPREILQLPKKFCVNIHPSLLPKYRGAAPINWAIISGEEVTGVSSIKMNADVDAGEIILQKKIPIDQNDTAITLEQKLSALGCELLIDTLTALEKNSYTLTLQDPAAVTLAPKLTKEDGRIDWAQSAAAIRNRIRGLLPWPGAFTHFSGKLLKVLEATVVDVAADNFHPGDVAQIDKEGFIVLTGQGGLRVTRVHPESSKAMDAKSFIVGHKLEIGSRLG